ncbi:transglutaminase domain-containing protein [Microbacterium sp. NPDC076895]|uniref:transglutaminase domain-containing protein n=1 Tax=Microbacterium sp. NPDC076895 TaxID=3154957 RepID=UPI003431D2D3
MRPAMVVGTAAFMVVAAAGGAIGMWPIYEDPWFLVMAAAAIALSIGVGSIALARSWVWWRTAISFATVFVVAGVPLAVPAVLTDPSQIPAALIGVLSAPVTGPNNLLTLELPLGTYQATLAPAFLVLLLAPGAALAIGARRSRWWGLAAPIALTPATFAIVFGATTATAGILAAVPILGLREALIGIASCSTVLLWMLWRAVMVRRLALREAGGIRQRPARRAAMGRAAIGTSMLLIAVIAAVSITPVLTALHPRTVPRSASEPIIRLAQEVSPLSTYRAMFAADTADEVLFEITTAGVDRVRLATLAFYDGQLARVTDPAAGINDPATAYTRLPSARLVGGDGVRADVVIGEYSGLWVPTVGTVAAIAFDGPDRAALADGFFYDAAAGSGIDISPVYGAGTSYTLRAAAPASMELSEATPPRSAPTLDETIVPESLTQWIRLQEAGSAGAGLADLVDRLRQRGYLSHALETPPPGTGWVADLGDYTFAPSRAGHSTDRIDALFTALVNRQTQLPDATDAELVAAVGDDEQFAVAAAMIADQLGFPSRIVVGARLQAEDGSAAGVPPCEDGTCRGRNITAWLEVQDVSGTWIPVDVTPQHEIPMDAVVDERRDPENATDVESERAEVVKPPEADPADADPRTSDDPESEVDLSSLVLGVQIAGSILLVLAILLGPLAVIVAVKAWRRRRRRRAALPAERIFGGWDEWVDATIDSGGPLPATRTRTEIVEAVGGADDARALAMIADHASFADESPQDEEATAFWQLVDRERERLGEAGSWRDRVRATLSLRSLRRGRRDRRP